MPIEYETIITSVISSAVFTSISLFIFNESFKAAISRKLQENIEKLKHSNELKTLLYKGKLEKYQNYYKSIIGISLKMHDSISRQSSLYLRNVLESGGSQESLNNFIIELSNSCSEMARNTIEVTSGLNSLKLEASDKLIEIIDELILKLNEQLPNFYAAMSDFNLIIARIGKGEEINITEEIKVISAQRLTGFDIKFKEIENKILITMRKDLLVT